MRIDANLQQFWLKLMLRLGKHRGRSYEEVSALDRGYCAWVLRDGTNGLGFREFARFLRREHGGILRVGRHKNLSLESPGEPMKEFVAFVCARLAEEEGEKEEPAYKRSRSQPFTCQICFDATVRSVLVPCGHMMCLECTAKTRASKCPFCRRKVQQVVKTFL